MSVCRTVSEIFLKEWRDFETVGRGRSRSLKIAPFDRSYTTFYWSAIVCCNIFNYLTLNNQDLEKVTESHFNWYHSKASVQYGGATRWWKKNFEDMYNRLDSIPACRRTDRQTSCNDIFRAMHTRRAVKNYWNRLIFDNYSHRAASLRQQSYFFHTPLHSTPPLGEIPSEYYHPAWCGKTTMVGLPDGEKNFEDMYNRLDSIPACDRQRDGRTDRHLATA